MATYFGKRKLTKILYHYLAETAPEKLAELKRELREAGEYRKEEIRYKPFRGDEWLKAQIFFAGMTFKFEIYVTGNPYKRVTMREYRVTGDEVTTETFSGYAYYKEFKPLDNEELRRSYKYSDALLVTDL